MFLRIVLFFCLIGGFLQSCNLEPCISKSYFLGTYKNFIKSINEESKHYSESDWKSKDSKIENFVSDCYPAHKKEMTGEERANFWSSYFQYMLKRHGSSVLEAIKEQDDDSITNIYDEMVENVKNLDIKKVIRDNYGNEIEETIDEISDQIKNIGNQLKDWLNTDEK